MWKSFWIRTIPGTTVPWSGSDPTKEKEAILRKSYMDSFRDFLYSAIRMSLPTCAERAAQVYPPRMAQTLEMREAAAILSPVANSTSRVAPDVPRLSISAAKVEITSAPDTSTINSRMVTAHSFQWGLRNRKINFIVRSYPFHKKEKAPGRNCATGRTRHLPRLLPDPGVFLSSLAGRPLRWPVLR